MEISIADTTVTIDETRLKTDPQPFLNRYLDGESTTFQGYVDLSDFTAFQQEVLETVRKIPYGTTMQYQTIARRIGRNDAARAVANVCGSNPVPILIPCHRVVAADGVGGYSDGGKQVKTWLLALEQN